MKKLMLGLMMAFAANVFAAPQPLGDTSTTWELKDNGTVLVIGGTGAMPDWEDWEISGRPWHDVRNAIESVVVGEGVTSVGANAFYGFGSLTNATLASTVTSIRACAFDGCSSLTRVAIPANVTSIGGSAFFNCSALSSVTIPEGVTSIGESAFEGCSSLTGVTIPASVTSIGAFAFSGCTSLTGVTIPANVANIGNSAFDCCSSLTSVTMKGATPPELGMFALGAPFDGKIYVPAGSKSAYEGGTGWRDYTSNLAEAYVVALAPTAHGAVAVDRDAFPIDGFPDGETVTVTAVPDEGFYLKSLVWNDGKDRDITADGQFTMPKKNVTVSATFREIPMTREKAEQVYWEAETAVSVIKTSPKLGGDPVSEENYAEACELYGLSAKPKPTAEDFKAVSKDAQVVQEGEIAVKKESIQAAGAETISIVNGEIQLGVSICSNANFTAETSDWGKVKFDENTKVTLSEDGTQIIISIPVSSQQGFMILQSGDAKVSVP